MDKRVIESNIPLKEISNASRHEKSVRHGHPSTLHLWWARRPLASSRATILAALLKEPKSKREEDEILNLIANITPWKVVKNPSNPLIDKAQQLIKKEWSSTPPKVLDPFSGGGSIPLEALRLGCETYASDINPIAVLISKVTLGWPQKLSTPNLAELVAKNAKNIQKEVHEEIGEFYPSDSDGKIPIGYLWCRTIPCDNPQCKQTVPLIKHFWLARTKKRQIAYKPILKPESNIPIQFIIQKDQNIDFNPSEGTISRATARCLHCNQVILTKKIREYAKEGKISQQMTIVILRDPLNPKKLYRPANSFDILLKAEGKTREFLPQPTTIESKAVYDADMINLCSPFGIAKTIFLNTKQGRNFKETINFVKSISVKAFNDLKTESGKEIGKKYFSASKEFLKMIKL